MQKLSVKFLVIRKARFLTFGKVNEVNIGRAYTLGDALRYVRLGGPFKKKYTGRYHKT